MLKITVEKGEHGSKGMRNGLGQTIPLVQQNYIKEINGWYWRDVVIFNETSNNDVTVYWGYIANLTESWVDRACEVC
jgi:hypothetical protein